MIVLWIRRQSEDAVSVWSKEEGGENRGSLWVRKEEEKHEEAGFEGSEDEISV